MTYRFPRGLAIFQFAAALIMLVALYIGTEPEIWGWLLFSPLFCFVVYNGLRSYRYSLTIDGDFIIVGGFDRAKYPISDIAAINVWPAKGDRIAVITFSNRKKLSFPSHLLGFDNLVDSIKKQVQPKVEA